jgi:hypothetical protein
VRGPHQSQPDPGATVGGDDPHAADPRAAAPNADVDEPDRLAVEQRDPGGAELEVVELGHSAQRGIVDPERDDVALERRREYARELREREPRRRDELRRLHRPTFAEPPTRRRPTSSPGAAEVCYPTRRVRMDAERSEPFNPVGNERLTAVIGIVVLVLTLIELATIPLGVHTFMSLHVFVGFVLVPVVALKLASTGWRFVRYYTGAGAYVRRGPPRLSMRLLAPLLVAATAVLFASGVAMGFAHGHDLTVARRLHGPASVVWLALVGVHVLVYLRRALTSASEEVSPSVRAAARGTRARKYATAIFAFAGVVVGIATVPLQHHWVDLRRDHHHHHDARASSFAARR